jgi:signal transduction histidine kinase
MSTDGAPSAYGGAARDLVETVQELSHARSVEEIRAIVRKAARRLTGADGATFVLRDGNQCHYVDEDAIGPLWKGKKFPLDTCISGWVMVNAQATTIEDIYADERIPHDSYRPTFVKSLAMVPIRTRDPIGAIGNYWAEHHRVTGEELALLQALADSTAVAMENVALMSQLEARVAARTAELEARTRELEDTNRGIQALFDEVVDQAEDLREVGEQAREIVRTLAHEVRNPLSAGANLLEDVVEYGKLGDDAQVRDDLEQVRGTIAEAIRIVTHQLDLERVGAGAIAVRPETVDVAELLAGFRATFRVVRDDGRVALVVEEPVDVPPVSADRHLLTQVLRNLIGNALKFTDEGSIHVRAGHDPAGAVVVFTVADTGVGIAAVDQERIFDEFEQVDGGQDGRPSGSGFGLAFVRRAVERMGGTVTLDSASGRGTTVRVSLPAQ